MPIPAPNTHILIPGFPAALEELRAWPDFAEPDLMVGLLGLLTAAAVSISYCEVEVLSGRAAHFIYSREHPQCAGLSVAPPLDTLFRSLDITWKEVTPSAPSTAFDVISRWIEEGHLTLARLKEPMLIYGISRNGNGTVLHVARPRTRLAEEKISQDDCERHFWRYPLDEGNMLVRIEKAPKKLEKMTALAAAAAHRAVRLWRMPELASCAMGDHAYRRLVADMADPDVDFTEDMTSPWMGPALWQQWTARASSQRFFKRVAPRLGGADRAAINHAAFCYEQCVESWKHWAACLGPTWDLARHGFVSPLPDDFTARWRNRELRVKGSHWIEAARAWEEKAITELTKTIR